MNRRLFLQMLGTMPVFSIIKMDKSKGMNEYLSEFSFNKDFNKLSSRTLAGHLLNDVISGDLVIIGSRPSMGKSIVALNLVHDLSLKKKKSVAFFSYELCENQVMEKLICIDSGFSQNQLKSENLGGNEIMKMVIACDKFSKSELLVSDKPLKVEELNSILPDKIDYIVIDYLQLVSSNTKYHSRTDEVAGTIDLLKSLAKEKDAVVIVLSQLNRGVESRSNRRPIPDDIRETRHLKPVHMYLIYREDYYSDLDKNANGPIVDMEIIKFDKDLKCSGTLVVKFNKQNLQVRLSGKKIS